MSHAPDEVRSFDRFKLIVVLLLVLLLFVLLCSSLQSVVAPGAAATSAPPRATAVAHAIAAPIVSAPTIRAESAEGQLILGGTGTHGLTVQNEVDGTVIGTATVGEDGKRSFSADLTAGDQEIAVIALDTVGVAVALGASPKLLPAAGGSGAGAQLSLAGLIILTVGLAWSAIERQRAARE